MVLGKIVLVGFGPVQGSAAWHAMVAGWAPVLAALAALSIVVGNFVALAQTNVRRLLAYSAVAHAGYTLLGLVAGGRDGFAATLFYTTIYADHTGRRVRRCRAGATRNRRRRFQKFRRTALALAFARRVHGDLHAFARRVAAAGRIFREVLPFQRRVARRRRTTVCSGWSRVALFGSLVSLYYYLMVLKAILVDEPAGDVCSPTVDLLPKIVVAALAVIVLILGLVPTPLVTHISVSLP